MYTDLVAYIIFGILFILGFYEVEINYIIAVLMQLMLCLGFSNIIHELGHAILCYLFKFKIKKITLNFVEIDFVQKKINFHNMHFRSNCVFYVNPESHKYSKVIVSLGGVAMTIIVIAILNIMQQFDIKNVFLDSLKCALVINTFCNGCLTYSTDIKLVKKFLEG